ncbi:MAG: ribonuclease J [Candidatus Campbellbacteria bacterium]|nr:ribonuclease J [Candidatus Campbellbacteria bacterium]
MVYRKSTSSSSDKERESKTNAKTSSYFSSSDIKRKRVGGVRSVANTGSEHKWGMTNSKRTPSTTPSRSSSIATKKPFENRVRRVGRGRKIMQKKKYIHLELSEKHMSKDLIKKIPPIAKGDVRILFFGGVEEIGRNMSAVQCGDEIVIVDCGCQFSVPSAPGIDYVLPNIRYLEENKDKIKAMLITHGHLDHIGGIMFLAERLGYPPIYSRNLTNIFIKRRQEEVIGHKPLDYNDVQADSVIELGENFVIKFFSVTHTIPDSMGIIINTPLGNVVYTGDVKLDHTDGVVADHEVKEYSRFKKDKVLVSLADSTNAENPGFSLPEKLIDKNLAEIIKNTKGRLIMGTFASQLERVSNIIRAVEHCNKKVIVDGRSLKTNVAIVQETGYLKVKKGTFIPIEKMGDYPKNKIVILATGAQADRYAVLMRVSNKTHKHIRLEKDDTIVLSSSVVPGNEVAVQILKDNLSRQGSKIITYNTSDVHASGHANRAELEWIHKKMDPEFFIPVHGHHYMLRVHAEIGKVVGIPEENIFIPDNGSIVEFTKSGSKVKGKILKEKMPSAMTTVDGLTIGDIQDMVIRDRTMLAADGIFTTIIIINQRTRKLKKSPDIISRGFVYLRESQTLLQESRVLIKKSVEKTIKNMYPINLDVVKKNLSHDLEDFLFQKTTKRPLIIPTIFTV